MEKRKVKNTIIALTVGVLLSSMLIGCSNKQKTEVADSSEAPKQEEVKPSETENKPEENSTKPTEETSKPQNTQPTANTSKPATNTNTNTTKPTTTKPSSGGTTTAPKPTSVPTPPQPNIPVGYSESLTKEFNSIASSNRWNLTEKHAEINDLLKKVASGSLSTSAAEAKMKENMQFEDTCNINNGIATYEIYFLKVTTWKTTATDKFQIAYAAGDAWVTKGNYQNSAVYHNSDGTNTIARISLGLTARIPAE